MAGALMRKRCPMTLMKKISEIIFYFILRQQIVFVGQKSVTVLGGFYCTSAE